ncbi:MAG: FecR domain-containing protein [Candidatus Saccharibacteria bacterium]|nr:FecR domain-containing protein [Rhodoferax sp.]
MKLPLHHHPRWPGFLASILILVPLTTWSQAAQPAIGYVKTVTGMAWVISGELRARAEPGVAVLLGSQLRTEAQASMGVTFKDNTVMSFGPDTELTVDEFVYAPAQGQLGLGARLAKGTLNYVSGVIAKLKPDAVSVKTPTGIIGVRGTHFVAWVEEPK